MAIFPLGPTLKKYHLEIFLGNRQELSTIYYTTLKSIPEGSFPIDRCPNLRERLESNCERIKEIFDNILKIFSKSDLSEGLNLDTAVGRTSFKKCSCLIDGLDLPRCSLPRESVNLMCDREDYKSFYAPKNRADLKEHSLKTAAVALNFYESFGFIDGAMDSLCQFLHNFGIESTVKEAKIPSKTKLFIKEKTTLRGEISSRRKIGEGTYGKVYFLEYNKRAYALKRMKDIAGGTFQQIRGLFLHEIAVYQMIPSFEHIVKIEACYPSGIFLEYAQGGILSDVIEGKLSTPLKIKSYFSCIAKGLKVIHEIGFNFKDLKSNNVLIFSDVVAKICDLGFATPSLDDVDKTVCQDYAAPEIFFLSGDLRISCKADIWSFGVLLFETLSSGKLPLFPHERKNKKYLSFVAKATQDRSVVDLENLLYVIGPQNMDFFQYLDPNLNFLKIAQKCLYFNPDKRPDANELVELLARVELV